MKVRSKFKKKIQNEYKIVSKLCVSAMFHVLIKINHHDHCDCDPSHQQNYWIFRFVPLKFLNDAQEKNKMGDFNSSPPMRDQQFHETINLNTDS